MTDLQKELDQVFKLISALPVSRALLYGGQLAGCLVSHQLSPLPPVSPSDRLHAGAPALPTGRYSCGMSGFRWSDIYATNGAIQTSDREKKKDIN